MRLLARTVGEIREHLAGVEPGVPVLKGDERAEITGRIDELQRFAAQLDTVCATLEAAPAPPACRTDLSCCVPEAGSERVPINLAPRRLDR